MWWGREILTRQVQQEISKWERLNTAHAHIIIDSGPWLV
jgi:hypothetical protein